MLHSTEPVSTASSNLTSRASEPAPSTLNQLYANAMRHHDRRAVLKWHDGSRWQTAPDWQLDRLVIRLGLYLHHRAQVHPGDRVALVSELRFEWLAADLAIQGLGAVSVTADPGLTEAELQAALADSSPRVAFVSAAAWEKLQRVRPALTDLEQVVVFDGPVPREGAVLYATVMDYAGTLDTPERAQAFRATARQVKPEDVTGRHYETEEVRAGLVGYQTLAQGDVLERIRVTWTEPAEPGDVAYLAGPEVTLATRLALYAMAGDGRTSTVLGRPDREAEELAETQPQTVILPPAVLRACLEGLGSEPAATEPPAGLATRLKARLAGWTGAHPLEPAQTALRRRFGGRVRRVGGATPLDADLRERLAGLGGVVG